ncbi:MAG: D-hexose-6-phosphate mutarotase [Gammaproteobacteria bacterium]|nr:D-hexose-6-phosphate mutarotase [Gammaproteobacteria bacterium]
MSLAAAPNLDVATLNDRYAIDDRLRFYSGAGDLPMVAIRTPQAEAVISLYGGQVLSFIPAGESDLLFLSKLAYYQAGKAIKGGVPICWPWFGADPEGQGRPAHGFARNSFWQVLTTSVTASGALRLLLTLPATEASRAIWPHPYELNLEIEVSEVLKLTLITRNCGDEPFVITQALHTYFAIGDIAQTTVEGLADCDYIDKAGGGQVNKQIGSVTVSAEVDRIYQRCGSPLAIIDGAAGRKIDIASGGSATAVVWNPWAAITASMADLNDDDYHHFICVESANAADEVVHLQPGASYQLTAVYRTMPLS